VRVETINLLLRRASFNESAGKQARIKNRTGISVSAMSLKSSEDTRGLEHKVVA